MNHPQAGEIFRRMVDERPHLWRHVSASCADELHRQRRRLEPSQQAHERALREVFDDLVRKHTGDPPARAGGHELCFDVVDQERLYSPYLANHIGILFLFAVYGGLLRS